MSEKTYCRNACASGRAAKRDKGVGSCGDQRRAAGAESRSSGLLDFGSIGFVVCVTVNVLLKDPERGGKGDFFSFVRRLVLHVTSRAYA